MKTLWGGYTMRSSNDWVSPMTDSYFLPPELSTKLIHLTFLCIRPVFFNQSFFFFLSFFKICLLVIIQFYLVCGGGRLCKFAGNVFISSIELFLVEKNKRNYAYFSNRKDCIAEWGQNKCKCIPSLIEMWGI